MTNIDQMLRFDGFSAAETLTGRSYKADKDTETLGAAFLMENGRQKRIALEAMGDTTFSNKLDRYQEIITTNGFELCLQDSFEGRQWRDEPVRQEFYFVYARRDGLLLGFDTHNTENVNSGKVWYNWTPNDWKDYYNYTSSGGQDTAPDGTKTYTGDHDCREALIYKMNRLTENGTFLVPWAFRHRSLWLASHMDWDKASENGAGHYQKVDHIEAITEDRLSRCPDWVREMVGERQT